MPGFAWTCNPSQRSNWLAGSLLCCAIGFLQGKKFIDGRLMGRRNKFYKGKAGESETLHRRVPSIPWCVPPTDMNNRSIAWWLRQIGLPQYTKILESEYYGLEGLLNVNDNELKEAGIEDASHRETILIQLLRHRQKLDPHSGVQMERRVSRKYSLGSSMDLVKPSKDLFRQSVLPRLHRADKKQRLSASCTQLRPLDEDHTSTLDSCREIKRSKRKSVAAYFSQLKVFGGRKEMDSLKKELEEELKLSTEDPRSHAWYHGAISREAAEALFERDGDFLVRDSSSSPGDYVLSCYWRNEPMHFKIIRVVLRPKKGYSRELFQFEEDRFDNVPALIRFYVGGRRPISQASGAIVFHPLNRTLPLRLIAERQQSDYKSSTVGKSQHQRSKRLSFSSTLGDAVHVNPLLRSGSHPGNLEKVGSRPSLQSAQSDSNLRPGASQNTRPQEIGPPPISPVFRTGSEPLLSPKPQQTRSCYPGGGVTLRGSDGQLHSRAPPKPLRISAVFPKVPQPVLLSDQDDDPSAFYDELVVQVPQSRRKGHVDRLRAEEKWQSRARITETSFGFLDADNSSEVVSHLPRLPDKEHFERPQTECSSCFRLDRFESLLLPDNNRPLEPSVLLALKELFNRSDPDNTALHMLSVDCQVARITGVTAEQRKAMGVGSGLELITLPHGQQLRRDLLERHHLISLGVAVDILGCTGTVSQRATVLHKFILLAKALKDRAHDLYSFSAVMKALDMPQIVRLEMTWRSLRRNHTESAVLFEKTLKPFLKSLNDSDECVLAGPVAVPHLVPMLLLMEGEDTVEDSERGCQTLYNVLQAARRDALHARDYQRHASALLGGGWTPIPEMLEAFQTEFALRLFWGQSGAEADSKERHDKFDKILCVLSDKLEPVEIKPATPQPLS
ncbi:breast cancer anti-estrogen resistance protein 3 homolog isoform X2 [Corythoichthys intestinalis]|uniref:breast cancer anti-estrogen resistance protein 3 homolog isoform X2 n=1 Tax=Corythoichthys intestinalis TaxID=161448 RepID=UPI0025A5108E|nr:breast cancer anti-estrogen resistance protein 3 homolog isoform X2 [Corythoichthys intestinalis]